MAEDTVGMDVERADAQRYFRRAALVQVGVHGRCVLLDGVALDELGELDRFLDGRRVVLHAVHNDLDPLASKGVRPVTVADTAIAAAMLGLPTGLGPLLTTGLGIAIDEDKASYQRADWERRPLSAGMAGYAAGDVVHLPALWEVLADRLEARGRTDWYIQELAATLARAGDDSRHWTRVKGAGRLGEDQRAVLRAVWEERERLARTHDLAPNRLAHDDVLRAIAAEPPRTEPQLVRRSRRRRSLLRRHAPDLLAAVERGLVAEPEPSDDAGHRWTDAERQVVDALRRTRASIAADLELDPGVLCPSRPLSAAVASHPVDADELCAAAGLRPWQTELLAKPLWEAYLGARAPGDD